jgi:hypothetical protein
MTEPSVRHRLEGLAPDNLLAFLALLGLLRALETSRHAWHPRAAWDVERAPVRPLLVLAQPQTRQAVCEAAAEGAAALAADHTFPDGIAENPGAQKDLNYSKAVARHLLEQAAVHSSSSRADLWSALMSDAATKDDKIEAMPLCLLFGQGHQHFLERLGSVPKTPSPPPRGARKKAVTIDASQTLDEALFAAWARRDPTPSFRWDPAEDVRYALRADDPSGDKSTTQHGANRLAALGLAALTVVPEQRGQRVRLQLVGGHFERGGFSFYWPIWREAASLAAIRALLSHPDLSQGPAALAHLSIVEIRQARRIRVGKFMNFTRADPVAVERRS